MRLSKLVNLGLIAAGAATSVKTLKRRAEWEGRNTPVYIVLDYDDALAVCTRAGLSFGDFLVKARDHGASHISLPEFTLHRLMAEGRVAAAWPAATRYSAGDARRGPRLHLSAADPDLLSHVTTELATRLPTSEAQLTAEILLDSPSGKVTDGVTLTVRGHLPALAEMGLGFDMEVAAQIAQAGLGIVPRPVSFSWPEDHLIDRTIAQAAGLGAKIIAFEGDIILGHEMHLDQTLESLEAFDLSFAYFCETRHQKGDWFIAKRRAPHGKVILSHYFTPQAMISEDYHSAAHHWGMLAGARGIRLCYVNVFRRIHATEPLECLHYLEHIREELEALGLDVGMVEGGRNEEEGAPGPVTNPPLSAPDRQSMALTGLATAGTISLAVSHTFNLREPLALGLAAATAVGAVALPILDRPRTDLEEAYPPSYAPKLLALAGAASAPIAATAFGPDPLVVLLGTAAIQAGTAASVAAHTTGQEYQQRIEEYHSLNADLFIPLAAVLFRELENPKARAIALALLGAGWYAANRLTPDLLARLDRDLPAGHTHHLSAARRILGDAQIALGPRPARRWAGLGLAGNVAASALHQMGHKTPAASAALAGAIGNAVALAAFRAPERPLKQTLPAVIKSWAGWGAIGLVLTKLVEPPRD